MSASKCICYMKDEVTQRKLNSPPGKPQAKVWGAKHRNLSNHNF